MSDVPLLVKHIKEPQASPSERLVLSITRMTIHNGPGIRTLVLFKGCPLRCLWCSTPDSQKDGAEIAVYPARCIHCDECIRVCPLNAIDLAGTLSINRSRCDNCGRCAQVCYSEAIKLLGQPMTVEQIIEATRRDIVFFKNSGGGVTISGGEPLLNPDFTWKLLRAFKEEGISIGVDTCGHVPWSNIERVLPYVDFFLWDIKHMDSEKHRQLTGVPNDLILNNTRTVSGYNVPIYLRLPTIPGLNDSEENIRAVCQFARGLDSLVEVSIIPLHHLGEARYASLGRAYPIADIPLPPDGHYREIKRLIESHELRCNIGG